MKAPGSKKTASDKDKIELEFGWATFCKGLAQEPDTQETTLIGIMPGMDVQVSVPAGHEKGPFNLPVPLWVYSQFRIKNPPKREVPLRLQFVMAFGTQSFPFDLDLSLKPGQAFLSANIRVAVQTGLPLVAGLQTLRGTFRHNGKDLGALELPIKLKVVVVAIPTEN